MWKSFDFSAIVWTDEKRFKLRPDGPGRSWRFKKERHDPKHTARQHKYGGGSVMVWGAMDQADVVELVLCSDNMDQWEYQGILLALLRARPDLSRPASGTVLMHDNASVHTACRCELLLKAHNVTLLPWPAVSPDLNPIEHLWARLAHRMKGRTLGGAGIEEGGE